MARDESSEGARLNTAVSGISQAWEEDIIYKHIEKEEERGGKREEQREKERRGVEREKVRHGELETDRQSDGETGRKSASC